jgi:hypothetical protein
MKSKEGAVIIGLLHSGEKSALNVIKLLEAEGIKEDDLIALELSEIKSKYFEEKIKSGNINDILNALRNQRSIIANQIKKTERTEPEYKSKVVGLSNKLYYIDKDLCSYTLLNFLASKKAKIINLQFSDPTQKMNNFETRRLRNYFVYSVRENTWKKRLEGKNPAFVLSGINHIPAIKRFVRYRKIVKMASLWGRRHMFRGILSRLSYKLAKKRKLAKSLKKKNPVKK